MAGRELATKDGIASAEIAGPGFINLRLQPTPGAGSSPRCWRAARPTATATSTPGATSTWSSSPPTPRARCIWAAPVGRRWATRWAVCCPRAAPRSPASTTSTTQAARSMRFVRSLVAAAGGEPAPDDGYGGDYIGRSRRRYVAVEPDALDVTRSGRDLPAGRRRADVRGDQGGSARVRHGLRRLVPRAVAARLRRRRRGRRAAQGLRAASISPTARWWLRSTEYGDDKDRPVIKSDGQPAYIAGDIAYYLDKRARGFDLCIYMLGADHHGYIGRLKAAAAAFGDDPAVVEVLIGQMVNLVARRQAGADEQARGHRRHDGRPGRRGGRRRGPVLADPLVGRLDAGRRPRPARAAQQRQPGLLRAVRARPAGVAGPQRRRPRASPRARRSSCWSTRARAT